MRYPAFWWQSPPHILSVSWEPTVHRLELLKKIERTLQKTLLSFTALVMWTPPTATASQRMRALPRALPLCRSQRGAEDAPRGAPDSSLRRAGGEPGGKKSLQQHPTGCNRGRKPGQRRGLLYKSSSFETCTADSVHRGFLPFFCLLPLIYWGGCYLFAFFPLFPFYYLFPICYLFPFCYSISFLLFISLLLSISLLLFICLLLSISLLLLICFPAIYRGFAIYQLAHCNAPKSQCEEKYKSHPASHNDYVKNRDKTAAKQQICTWPIFQSETRYKYNYFPVLLHWNKTQFLIALFPVKVQKFDQAISLNSAQMPENQWWSHCRFQSTNSEEKCL